MTQELSQQAREFRARRSHLGAQSVTTGAERFNRPWFNSWTAAQYLDKPTREAFWVWAKRKGVVPVKRAGCLLYAKADIDRVLGLLGKSA